MRFKAGETIVFSAGLFAAAWMTVAGIDASLLWSVLFMVAILKI